LSKDQCGFVLAGSALNLLARAAAEQRGGHKVSELSD
jgi:hypothetical protein